MIKLAIMARSSPFRKKAIRLAWLDPATVASLTMQAFIQSSQEKAMDLGYLPPLPVALMSAATRDLAFRAARSVAAARRLLPSAPGIVVLAAVSLVWLLGFIDWGSGSSRALAGLSGGSFVATVAVAVGWAADPDRLERWAVGRRVVDRGAASAAHRLRLQRLNQGCISRTILPEVTG